MVNLNLGLQTQMLRGVWSEIRQWEVMEGSESSTGVKTNTHTTKKPENLLRIFGK